MTMNYPQTETTLSSYNVGPVETCGLNISVENDPLRADSVDEFYRRAYLLSSGLEVEVDGDPVKFGISRFHNKTSDIRKYQNFVVRLIFVGIRIRTKRHAAFLYAKEIFEQEVRAEMAKIPSWEAEEGSTRKYRVDKDTKRLRAELKLEESRRQLQGLEEKDLEAKSFVEAMTLLRDNLKLTRDDLLFSMTAIRTQMLVGEVPVVNTNLYKTMEKNMLEKMQSEESQKFLSGGEVEL